MTETETPSRLLIVDDTLANLRISTDVMCQQGYTVRGVRNGDMGLAVASTTTKRLPLRRLSQHLQGCPPRPMGRAQGHIIWGVAYLCNPRSTWVTGEVLGVRVGLEGVAAAPPKRGA